MFIHIINSILEAIIQISIIIHGSLSQENRYAIILISFSSVHNKIYVSLCEVIVPFSSVFFKNEILVIY
jgi:hypothetical protein